jgi:Periplasmic binding protein domain
MAHSDPMEASYLGVHLWAQAVEEAGTRDTSAVREALRRQKFDAPSGPVRIDSENQRTWKTVRLGKIVEGGQFEIVWSSEKPIRPEPYPRSRPTGAWDEFLAGLQTVARALDQASKLKSNDKWREIALPPHRPHWTFTNPRQEPIVLALPAAEVGTFSTITTRGTQA